MKAYQASIVVLRTLLGWFLIADSWILLSNEQWSAASFLNSAKTFHAFYAWFALPMNIGWVNIVNEWGIMLIGIALILGIAVRPAAWVGVIMMVLYYFPHYAFPFAMQYGWIVEEHLIYASALAAVALSPYAEAWGLGNWARSSFLGRVPLVRELI